jgi:hypothetical protein
LKLCTEPLRACHAGRADRPLLLLLAKSLPIGLAVGIEAITFTAFPSGFQFGLGDVPTRAGSWDRARVRVFG